MYLAARGIEARNVDFYFNASFADLSDPFRFPGIETAVKRLWKAIVNREHILIHGDYDTDGITATALLSWILERNGAIVTNFLPHRFDDGYGFTPDSLAKALEAAGGNCGVLVTVDCGINSCEAVEDAAKRGRFMRTWRICTIFPGSESRSNWRMPSSSTAGTTTSADTPRN